MTSDEGAGDSGGDDDLEGAASKLAAFKETVSLCKEKEKKMRLETKELKKRARDAKMKNRALFDR